MFHHQPYSESEFSYHVDQLHAAVGHARALNTVAMLASCGGVVASAVIGWIYSLPLAAAVLTITVLVDLGRGFWARSLLDHFDAGLYELRALDRAELDALTVRCARDARAKEILDRWMRQRHTLRQRDAGALNQLLGA